MVPPPGGLVTRGDVSEFGDSLRALRERSGLGQGQLAAQLGVRQQTISRWERGAALPRPTRIVELARALGVGPAVLHRLAGYLPEHALHPRNGADAELRCMREWLADLDEETLLWLVDTARNQLQRRQMAEQIG